MHCPQCQHHNSDTAKFCEECGARLVRACSQCGQQVSPTAKFCAECGTALTSELEGKLAKGHSSSSAAQPLTPRGQPPTGERRQLTVLFCDLVGSTALSAKLDPEDLRVVVPQYQQACAEVIQRYNGYIA